MNKYQIRNLIILGSVLGIVVLMGGYFVAWSYPGKIAASQKELSEADRNVKSLDGIENEFEALDKLLKEKAVKLTNIDKQIYADITTANVYDYLNTILHYSGIIEFNLAYLDTKNMGTYGYNSYTLGGEATFGRLYNFIAYLEQGPHVYEIEKLDLRGMESTNPDTDRLEVLVPFDIEIKAYFATVENMNNPAKKLGDIKFASAKNPFHPYILRNLPANVDKLIDVERAALKAIIPGKALVADESGDIHVLNVGDRVYLGYLTRIISEQNEVEFTLNKGGIVETYMLNLDFDETTKEGK